MTWSDPIVDEVRRVRDAYAARFNYDLRAIFKDLKEQEKRSGREFVSAPDENSVVGLPLGESSAGEHASPPSPAKTPRE
jgi:hypothetical protein